MLGRLGVALVSFLLLFYAGISISRDELSYPNYWGGIVFAPIACIIGVLGLIIAIRGLRNSDKKNPKEKDDSSRSSKHDDWQKW